MAYFFFSCLRFSCEIYFLKEGKPSAVLRSLDRASFSRGPPQTTILFIPLSARVCNSRSDWTNWAAGAAEAIIRECPFCLRDSIVGHGRRRKQAHDEKHDWIRIRRGICRRCDKTFTFLPFFSLPYTHYSLVARSQALERRFVDNCSWEEAAPSVKDANRIADPSTLGRWFSQLDCSEPRFSLLRSATRLIHQWLERGEVWDCAGVSLSRQTLFPFLQHFWPLRC